MKQQRQNICLEPVLSYFTNLHILMAIEIRKIVQIPNTDIQYHNLVLEVVTSDYDSRNEHVQRL